MGLEQTVEEKAGVSHSTVDRVRRVCWEMPCKVYIPCCLFTWRKFPAGYMQGAGSQRQKTQDAKIQHITG